MRVRELQDLLARFDPEARVVLSAKGHHLPLPHVGVGLDGAGDPCVVVADREAFAGRLPDMVLTARPP